MNYFQKRGVRNGNYLDIGAFHPTWISNTHLLHKAGWSGAAVDVDPYKMKAFNWLRGSKVKTFLGAVSTDSNNKIIRIYRFHRFWSEIDTLSESEAKNFKEKYGYGYSAHPIQSISLEQMFSYFPKVHFLNIDIEGLDEEILLNLNLKKDSPKNPDVIVFEDNKNWGGSLKIQDFLKGLGYQHLFTSMGSIGYCLPINGAQDQ